MGDVSWPSCLQLNRDLQADVPGIGGRIKNVKWLDFTDFYKLIEPSKKESDVDAVKTVIKKIGHLKGCSTAICSPCLIPTSAPLVLSISDQYKILRCVLGNVKVEELDFDLNSATEFQRHEIFALIIKFIALATGQLDVGLPVCKIDSSMVKFARFVIYIWKTLFFRLGAPKIMHDLAGLCTICQAKTLRLRNRCLTSEQLMEFVKSAKDSMIVMAHIDDKSNITEDSKFALRQLLENNKKKIEVSVLEAVMNVEVKKSTGHFYELNVGHPQAYPISSRPRKGRALIINNEFLGKVINGEDMVRMGSIKDFDNQVKLWTAMDFTVTQKKDLSARAMKETFEKFALDARDSNIIAVIVMTHGGKTQGGNEYFQGDDRGDPSVPHEEDIIFTQEVISMIDTANLEGIPKVFLFQACRGGKRDRGIATDAMGTNKVRSRLDMLIAYPCQTDHVSYRNEANGSWHMNAVTNVFMKHSHDTHVLGMMTMVNSALSNKETEEGEVQVPRQETSLRKDIYLFPGWLN